MILKHLFVIVPSLLPTGPVKGAVALCNGLADRLPVTLVVLKPARGAGKHLKTEVRMLSLAHLSDWRQKRRVLRAELEGSGGRNHVASISFCLSADAMNFSLGRYAIIVSSVRGNLPKNYRFDYGPAGRIVAWLHLTALRHFDRVVAMSDTMAAQLRHFGLTRISVIGNFVDEQVLEHFRLLSGPIEERVRFLFLASLSKRKRPELLLAAAGELDARGVEFQIDIAGEGPLELSLREFAEKNGLAARVIFHGQLAQPFELLQRVDYMVLPSESEGIPRAALEALFFGVPCILRDVDANRDLIEPGRNGALFHNDRQLVELLERAERERYSYRPRRNLLPPMFRQRSNIDRYLESLNQ